MESSVELFALIKFGAKHHMQQLYDDGVLYMNHISEFVRIEDSGLRGDKYESALSMQRMINIDIAHNGIVIAKAERGKITMHEDNPVGNIYSMYGLKVVDDLSQIKVDERCKNFGDSCVILHNVPEFISRVNQAASTLNMKLLYEPVQYQNLEEYEGNWSLFKKPDYYKYQREFRLLIKQEEFIGPIILSIGSIHDIAVMLGTDKIDGLKVERRKQL
ncbi:hypothetical protein Q5H92_08280 [Hymenobacter sp. M29]|uniref:Uncharacterized protein n=1 Tax=Hymenobacter mellowenesis TaxID=3063995 RepID=A0ABT9AAF1_9BACT|nr:hypothetical protein [Hymenobacter sp. M29]MDO7846349.1 hypothetical protein [Hymenobacter sp. M29]